MRSHKKRNRGVNLIMSCTYEIGRRRLSKLVMGGVHLHLFFWRRLSIMKWRHAYKMQNGVVLCD